MKTLRASAITFIIVGWLAYPQHLWAQLPDGVPVLPPTSPAVVATEVGPDVAITLASGKSAIAHTLDRVAERVGLQPNEVVSVTVQFGAASAGQLVTVVPLDGGRIIGNENKLFVGSDGSLRFKFQAEKDPGVYEIALRQGNDSTGLQFWVMDNEHPEKNPAVVAVKN